MHPVLPNNCEHNLVGLDLAAKARREDVTAVQPPKNFRAGLELVPGRVALAGVLGTLLLGGLPGVVLVVRLVGVVGRVFFVLCLILRFSTLGRGGELRETKIDLV